MSLRKLMKMKHKPARCLLPVAAALACLGAQAQSGESAFSFSGFGTVGVVGTSSNGAQYVLPGQIHGADKDLSGEVDTKLGLQLTGRLNPMFSATGQLLTKQNGKGSWTPELEWAFVKAQLAPSLALRVGRMGAPFFAVSDFRDVGYANTWLRPPLDVYGQVPVSRFDGADALYQTNLGDTTLSAQLFGGASKSHFEGTELKLKKIVGVNATAEFDGGITLRVGHAQGELHVYSDTVNGLVATLRGLPVPAIVSVGNQLSPAGKDASFTGIGLGIDRGQWLANVEYTKRRTDTYIPDTTGWYGTLGLRFGKFTPYATVSRLKVDDTNVGSLPSAVGVPAIDAALPVLRAGVAQLIASQFTEQNTVGLGLRWDAWRNIALKAQYERIDPKGSAGLFTNPQPGFGAKTVNVYSLAVDFVF
jgi:hypothetical protein